MSARGPARGWSMFPQHGLVLLMALVAVTTLGVNRAAAEGVKVISGLVTDSEQRPVAGAKVTPWDNNQPLFASQTRTSMSGMFQVIVPNLKVQRVALEVSAAGFDVVRRTVAFQDRADFEASPFELTRSKAVIIDSAAVLQSADGTSQYIEVFLRNSNPQDHVTVQSIRVLGSATATVGATCIDAGPAVTYQLADILEGPGPSVAGKLTVESQKGDQVVARRPILASGELTLRAQCGVSALAMRLPYPLSFAPGEQTRIRVVAPAKLKLTQPPLKLAWQPSSVGVVLDSGLLVEHSL